MSWAGASLVRSVLTLANSLLGTFSPWKSSFSVGTWDWFASLALSVLRALSFSVLMYCWWYRYGTWLLEWHWYWPQTRACLDHLTRWSMIVTSSIADRDQWLLSPSVEHTVDQAFWVGYGAQWAGNLSPVWIDGRCRSVGRPVGKAGWLCFNLFE